MRPEGAVAVQLPLVDRAPWTVIAGRLAPANDDRPAPLRLGIDRLLAESSAAFAARRAKALVLPAGTLRAGALPALCTMAHRLGDHCERLGIDLLVAGDVVHGEEWAPIRPLRESYVFGFSRGQWRIHGAPHIEAPHRIRAHHLRSRVMLLGERRVCALLAAEVFAKGLREAVEALDVDAVIVLSHHAATRRWDRALRLLTDVAPVVVISTTASPRGFDHERNLWEQSRLVQLPGLALDALELIRT